MNNKYVFVGTYTHKDSQGIYRFRYGTADGTLSECTLVAESGEPSFLALNSKRTYLYAANEYAEQDGGVSAFAIDPGSGNLTLLGTKSSGGTWPCHISVTADDRYLLTANYGTGTATIHPIADDGSLLDATGVVEHSGSGPHPRQVAPHAHSINVGPDDQLAFVADLGIDRVVIYRIDHETRKLVAAGEGTVPAGHGPRHFAFHPSGAYAYAINELVSSVTPFRLDAARGVLEELDTISTLPDDCAAPSTCADIRISSDGRFVYGSNRGHDSIAVFAVEDMGATLRPIDHTPTGGEHPRNFGLSPDGDFLLVANQDSNNIVTMKVDKETGLLTPTGDVAECSMPVCLVWW